MTNIPNKLKLEVKSNDKDVAKFVSSEKYSELCFTPINELSNDFAILGSSVNELSSSNIFQISAHIGTNTSNKIASFNFTNNDLNTTTILKGNLIIEGSVLSLGTHILNDENDNVIKKTMPKSANSNLITERYTSLLYSNIYATSNKIITDIDILHNSLERHSSNIFTIGTLFKDISFLSFNDNDFDNSFITKTTDNISNGTSNTFIVDGKYENNLTLNSTLTTSKLISNKIEASTIHAKYLYGDGSYLTNIYKGDGTTSSIVEGSNLFYTNERVVPIIDSSNVNLSNYIDNIYSNVIDNKYLDESNNSNYIISANDYLFSTSSNNITNSSNMSYDNKISYDIILATSNIEGSNIIDNFERDTVRTLDYLITDISNYITNSSNLFALLEAGLFLTSNDASYIFDEYVNHHSNISNIIVNNITSYSSDVLTNLTNNETKILWVMQGSSNYIDEMIQTSINNNSNNIYNTFSNLDVLISSNIYNNSNVIDDIGTMIDDRVVYDKSMFNTTMLETSNAMNENVSVIYNNVSNYINIIDLELFDNISCNFNNYSNNLINTSNTIEVSSIELSNIINGNILNISNVISNDSNNIIKYIFETKNANSYDISNISNIIIDKIYGLTTDDIIEGDNKYFTSNKFFSNFKSLTLDNINNGITNKFITNNLYDDSLIVTKELQSSNLIIMGSNTVLLTNTINSGQLEIISSSFQTGLSIQQNIQDSNILDVIIENNSNIFTVQHGKVGIKKKYPEYELDVDGTVRATNVVGSGTYLYNVNLDDKTTSDIIEGSNLYYTDARVSSLVNYSNINVSNYILDTSNLIADERNMLLESGEYFLNNVSNYISSFIITGDVSQSNYILTNSDVLLEKAVANILNNNQSNYINSTSNTLNLFLSTNNTQQSNYINTFSNNIFSFLSSNDTNNSNYISNRISLNYSKLSTSNLNTSNYIISSSNIILQNLNSLNILQSNYTQLTSNRLFNSIQTNNLNMSNYILYTSNENAKRYTLNNLNNSNYISSTSNALAMYISTFISQSANPLPVDATNTPNINRWGEPTNYITDRNIYTIDNNYINYTDGCIGIGLTKPSATLDIYTLNASSNSIKVNNNIWAQTGIIYSSDKRIKKDIVDLNDGIALEQVLSVEPKMYNYIDENRLGDIKDIYGFIAQQVQGVIPNAISLQKGSIPNIYCDGIIYENNILMIRNDIGSIIHENTEIDIIYKNRPYRLRIEEIYSENTFKVDNLDNIIGDIFVYGTFIEDFHTIDKSYIYTLNVCATQDLYRQQMNICNKIDNIKDRYYITKMDKNKDDIEEYKVCVDNLKNDEGILNVRYGNLIEQYNNIGNLKDSLVNIIDRKVDTSVVNDNIKQIENENTILKTVNDRIYENNYKLRRILGTMTEKVQNIRDILVKNKLV